MKRVAILFATIVLLFTMTGCGSADEDGKMISMSDGEKTEDSAEALDNDALLKDAKTIKALIDVDGYGEIALDLFPDIAPITVENFVKLVKDGFYDGLTFHRIMDGFMIQGGDPEGTGLGGSEEKIKGEFSNNNVENKISHVRGVLSMARSGESMDSASSQFFIVQNDSLSLNGDYAAFGRVTSGIEIVDAICKDAKPTDNNGTISAEEQPKIKSIKIVEE